MRCCTSTSPPFAPRVKQRLSGADTSSRNASSPAPLPTLALPRARRGGGAGVQPRPMEATMAKHLSQEESREYPGTGECPKCVQPERRDSLSEGLLLDGHGINGYQCLRDYLGPRHKRTTGFRRS